MMGCGNSEASIVDIFTEALDIRLNALILGIESLDEYKSANTDFIKCLWEIRNNLPEDKKNLTVKLDDYFSHILSVCEKYYYKNGFTDALKLKDLVCSQKKTMNL
ncbi:MAG: hypothetical protein ACOX7R_01905 [Acetivibrionales bacterium]|jgi:hypothetical protein